MWCVIPSKRRNEVLKTRHLSVPLDGFSKCACRIFSSASLCKPPLIDAQQPPHVSPFSTLPHSFFRSIRSEGHTGVNTVPTSCGASLLREWNVQVRAPAPPRVPAATEDCSCVGHNLLTLGGQSSRDMCNSLKRKRPACFRQKQKHFGLFMPLVLYWLHL